MKNTAPRENKLGQKRIREQRRNDTNDDTRKRERRNWSAYSEIDFNNMYTNLKEDIKQSTQDQISFLAKQISGQIQEITKSTAIYAKLCNATINSCNAAINTNIPSTTTIKHSKTRRSENMRNKMKNVSIMYLNIRGLKSKLESLKEIIDEQKPDVIALVEIAL